MWAAMIPPRRGGSTPAARYFALPQADAAPGPRCGASTSVRAHLMPRPRCACTIDHFAIRPGRARDDHETKWRLHGVRVVHANELDTNTPQTPGMNRAAAITHARTGAEKLWAGTVVIHPKAKTGAHHHGAVESVIYVVSGRARMKWGDRLEFTAEAGPGDFIYVPPFVPHQEINASDNEPLSCVLCRSGQEPVVVNLDLPNVEPNPEEVHWVDNIHPAPNGSRVRPYFRGRARPDLRLAVQPRNVLRAVGIPRVEREHDRLLGTRVVARGHRGARPARRRRRPRVRVPTA